VNYFSKASSAARSRPWDQDLVSASQFIRAVEKDELCVKPSTEEGGKPIRLVTMCFQSVGRFEATKADDRCILVLGRSKEDVQQFHRALSQIADPKSLVRRTAHNASSLTIRFDVIGGASKPRAIPRAVSLASLFR